MFLAGDLPPAPRLAIVGSRAAHRRFATACEALVKAAHGLGWSVVSGGALGIDAAVHRAAVAARVPQLAVLPCGPDRCYPPHHRGLFAEVLSQSSCGSGILFAHPAGTKTVRAMFASRNRIVVDLCEAVIVVEAALRSGSLVTASLARQKKRKLAAIPGTDGCGKLLQGGAHGLPPVSAGDKALTQAVQSWLTGQPRPRQQVLWPVHLQQVRELFDPPKPLEVETLDDPLQYVGELLEAEMLGLVVEVGPGRYVLTGG